MAFLTESELQNIGFGSIGSNVLISDKCSIYNPGKLFIQSNVRIDDFCILSPGDKAFEIGHHVHIACYVSLIGNELISIGNFVGISSKCAIYSSSDDYSGRFLTGPTIAQEYKNVDSRNVVFEDHVLIGAQSVVLPGIRIKEGTAVGALSLVTKDLEAWKIFAGNPLELIKERSKEMLKYALEINSK